MENSAQLQPAQLQPAHRVIKAPLTDQCIDAMNTALARNKVVGVLGSNKIFGESIRDVQELAWGMFPHCIFTKFAIPATVEETGVLIAYYIGYHPVSGSVEIARSDHSDVVVTTNGDEMILGKLFELYDDAVGEVTLSTQPTQPTHTQPTQPTHMQPTQPTPTLTTSITTNWVDHISDCLQVTISESIISREKPTKPPGPTAPSEFEWITLTDDKYNELCDQVEVLKCGWKIIEVLKRINVDQSPDNLAYWSPSKILLFFGIISE